jgi:hypothetical protein
VSLGDIVLRKQYGLPVAQWKITGGYDYAWLPNRQWNKKQKT